MDNWSKKRVMKTAISLQYKQYKDFRNSFFFDFCIVSFKRKERKLKDFCLK